LLELHEKDELHLRTRENRNSYKPKAKYTLSLEQKRSLCEWLCVVCLSNGCSFNFCNKINTSFTKLQNMKSNDYNICMETFLPIAFSALLVDVLEPLSAGSEFFKNLSANVLNEDLLNAS